MMMMKHLQKRRFCRRVFSALGRCLLLLSLVILLERGNVMVMVVSALLTTAFAPRSPRMLVLRPSASSPCFARPGSPLATRGAIALHGNHGDSHRNAPSRIFGINPTTTPTTIGTKRRTFTALSMSSTSSSSSTSSTAAASSSQPPPPALSLENISCSHNGGETWQLKDVSYVLPRGAKVALVGRNGAGKVRNTRGKRASTVVLWCVCVSILMVLT
jgi:ABC-type multidrug transport system fused ATPase/permease subunit